MKVKRIKFLITILGLVFLSCGIFYAGFHKEPVSYNQDIRPIFNSKCITCHGGVKKSGGFSVLFREEALDTTESGVRGIVPGNADASELIRRIESHDPEARMPLDAEPLSQHEIDLLKTWINQGAQWEKPWAYIPPKTNFEIPKTDQPDWSRNAIDHFVYAKLQEKGLSPAPEADKTVLLRRLSLDLTGLPPTPAEVQNFQEDHAPDAYEKAVDRLLSSPHFGEHWATMWLDLARYADTKGYEKDLNRNIWQYRDWVINAFNNDMPFDQFTIEQLAGDLLPNPDQSQYIATAFHRNTIANDEGGTSNEEFRVAAIIDRVSTTWEVWQGTTIACVQCHSHPYDPIRHEEFYKAFAFFNNTQDRDIYNEQPKLFTYAETDQQQVEELMQWLEDHLEEKDKINPQGEFLHEQRDSLLNYLGYKKVEAEEFTETSRFIELTAPEQLAVWQIQDSSWIMFKDVDLTNIQSLTYRYVTPYSGTMSVRLDSAYGPIIGKTIITQTGDPESPDIWNQWKIKTLPLSKTTGTHDVYFTFGVYKHYTSDLFRLDWFMYNEENPLKSKYGKAFDKNIEKLYNVQAIETPIMRDLSPKNSRTTHVFTRGNWLTPAEEVAPAVPASMGQLPAGKPANRLALAQWLVSDENPLTARVTVNRFWEKIFGYGLIETLEDFGTQGVPPSHPQLLDWLAVQFRDQYQWSVKKLLKEIVISATYRQASVTTPEKIEKDPRNKWLSRGARVRLSAEQIRDQVLAVSGLLNNKMYGPSVYPPQPESVGAWPASEGEDAHRRALYTFWHRSNPYPSFITFDSPERSVCVSRRIRTNTPLQALTLLNDTVTYEAAQALAMKMNTYAPNETDAMLAAGYQMVMFRQPGADKLSSLRKLYEEALAYYQQNEANTGIGQKVAVQPEEKRSSPRLLALTLVANALLNLDEFITKN